jgi:hypothetical protein
VKKPRERVKLCASPKKPYQKRPVMLLGANRISNTLALPLLLKTTANAGVVAQNSRNNDDKHLGVPASSSQCKKATLSSNNENARQPVPLLGACLFPS